MVCGMIIAIGLGDPVEIGGGRSRSSRDAAASRKPTGDAPARWRECSGETNIGCIVMDDLDPLRIRLRFGLCFSRCERISSSAETAFGDDGGTTASGVRAGDAGGLCAGNVNGGGPRDCGDMRDSPSNVGDAVCPTAGGRDCGGVCKRRGLLFGGSAAILPFTSAR